MPSLTGSVPTVLGLLVAAIGCSSLRPPPEMEPCQALVLRGLLEVHGLPGDPRGPSRFEPSAALPPGFDPRTLSGTHVLEMVAELEGMEPKRGVGLLHLEEVPDSTYPDPFSREGDQGRRTIPLRGATEKGFPFPTWLSFAIPPETTNPDAPGVQVVWVERNRTLSLTFGAPITKRVSFGNAGVFFDVSGVAPDGFWGRWVDGASYYPHDLEGPPSGYFCAIRVSPSPGRRDAR